MKEIYYNTVQEFNDYNGFDTLHPLVSVARFNQERTLEESVYHYGLYALFLNYKIPCSGVISSPAASTSCRSFFITSAGIHLHSTLTVRTRLRLRTMSIGA